MPKGSDTMIGNFNFAPTMTFTGTPTDWKKNINEIILLNIIEMKYKVFDQQRGELKNIKVYARKEELDLVEDILMESIPRLQKIQVEFGNTDKLVIELYFERKTKKLEYAEDYSLEVKNTEEILLSYYIKMQNIELNDREDDE